MINETWTGWRLSDFKQNDTAWIQHSDQNNSNYIYINIPKNASSWMKNNFGGWSYNFRDNKFDQPVPPEVQSILQAPNPATYVIVLRDPVERWLSGAAQAVYECAPDDPGFFMNWSDSLIFDTVAFDEHTAPQTMFLQGIDLSRVVWFDCTNNLESNLIAWSKDKFPIDVKPISYYAYNAYKISRLDIPQNLDDNSPHWTMMQCIDALRQRLFNKPEHLEKIKLFYKDDYKLRESVKFYGTR